MSLRARLKAPCFRLIALALLCAGLAMAQAQAVTLSPAEKRIELSDRFEFHRDPSGQQTLADVLALPEGAFRAHRDGVLNLGFTDAAIWVRLELTLPEDATNPQGREWVLVLDYPYLDEVTLFSPSAGGYQSVEVGDTRPFAERPMATHHFAFPLQLAPGETRTYYLRVQTTTTLQLPLAVWEEKAFNHHYQEVRMAFGLFYGAMGVMLFYNLFLLLAVRDRAYLFYVAYLAGFLFMQASVNGLGFQYLWPDYPALNDFSISLWGGLAIMMASQFVRQFLHLEAYLPWLNRVFHGLSGLGLLVAIFALTLSPAQALRLNILLGLVMFLAILATSTWAMVRRLPSARIFFIAWIGITLGGILRAAALFEWLPSVFITRYGLQLGSVFEIVLLSLALASRINQARQSKYEAVKAMLASEQEREKARQELDYRSRFDVVTGLLNRSHFIQAADERLAEAGEAPVQLVQIHLRRFREINHTLGHRQADEVLAEIGERLDQMLRHECGAIIASRSEGRARALANVEGTTFAALVPGSSESVARHCLPLLQNLSDEPLHYAGMSLQIDLTAGMAAYPGDGRLAEVLMRKANVAIEYAEMISAPAAAYNPEIDPYSERRLSLMGELREAMGAEGLFMVYHPQIDLSSGQVVALEALLRWKHARHGLIPPPEFIGLAEKTGVIRELTHWVLEASVRQARALTETGWPLTLSVNVSARNLLETDFAETVRGILERHGVAPAQLTLEITESAFLDEMKQGLETLEELRALGLSIAIDDFGTGYSSLSYLKRFPAREIKIDRSFVSDMLEDSDDFLIVDTTIRMGQAMGLKVVAEGVENELVYQRLRELGCDSAQGFWMTKPLPADELIHWLSQWRAPNDSIDVAAE